MGTIIRATAVYSESTPIESVVCSARAAERCLEAAGIAKTDVDLIISTGVYREKNLAEPALAALIQKQVGANPDPFVDSLGNRTFSFDLMNGPVALLNAVEVAGSMLGNRRFKNALIVSNDVHPSLKTIPDFPFSQVGTATLLTRSDEENAGFKRIAFKTSARTDSGFRGHLSLKDCGCEARYMMKVEVEKDYIKRLTDFTVSTVGEFLREHAGNGSDITHIVCSLPTVSFGHDVARALSLSPELVVSNYKDYGDAHTSSLAASFHAAKSRRLFRQGDTILFVGAGAGLTCGCGLYRV